jgi:hypothetical protein
VAIAPPAANPGSQPSPPGAPRGGLLLVALFVCITLSGVILAGLWLFRHAR